MQKGYFAEEKVKPNLEEREVAWVTNGTTKQCVAELPQVIYSNHSNGLVTICNGNFYRGSDPENTPSRGMDHRSKTINWGHMSVLPNSITFCLTALAVCTSWQTDKRTDRQTDRAAVRSVTIMSIMLTIIKTQCPIQLLNPHFVLVTKHHWPCKTLQTDLSQSDTVTEDPSVRIRNRRA